MRPISRPPFRVRAKSTFFRLCLLPTCPPSPLLSLCSKCQLFSLSISHFSHFSSASAVALFSVQIPSLQCWPFSLSFRFLLSVGQLTMRCFALLLPSLPCPLPRSFHFLSSFQSFFVIHTIIVRFIVYSYLLVSVHRAYSRDSISICFEALTKLGQNQG